MKAIQSHIFFFSWLLVASLASVFAQSTPKAIDLQSVAIPLGHVRLLESPYLLSQEADARWLLALSPDRLLHRYRLFAGLPPKGEIYQGWENRGISGHSLGHYLSACALMYAATEDNRFLERVNYIVEELAACQQAKGTGYLGAIPEQDRIWAEVAAGDIRSQGFDLNGGWVPWYTQHKLWAGLIDAYRLTGSAQALKIVVALSDWVQDMFGSLSEAAFQEMLACEHGGMNEAFADLYAITKNPTYLALSKKFDHHLILHPLAAQEDHLAGKHSNTQIPKVIGAARQYELTGNRSDSTAAAFFFHTVVHDHSYVNGGNSEHEHFGPAGQLANRLSNASSETCNTYNMLKLAQHLQTWNLDAELGDYVERALLNHILASQNPENGMVTYFVPLQAGGQKTYSTPDSSFWCCVGTGMENHAKYGAYLYYELLADKGLVIDQFVPSRLQYKGWDLALRSEYPASEEIHLDFRDVPAGRPLYLRKPAWTTNWSLTMDGETAAVTELPNGYLKVLSPIKSGSKLDFRVGMNLRSEGMPDQASRRALFYGPTLLAGLLDTAIFRDPLDYPVFVADAERLGPWLIATDSVLHFRSVSAGKPADVLFKPFYQVIHEPYLVYLDFYDEASWQEKQVNVEAQKREQEDLRRRTLDVLRIGEMQPERDHELEGENTVSGEALGRKWRHAVQGYFQFVMAVDKESAHVLSVTYWGGDAGNREFDILIDGQVLATQTLERNHPDEFFDQPYVIPAAWTAGKEKVTVRFQAKPGMTAGGVYGCRMLRAGE